MALPATEAFTGVAANLADPPWKMLPHSATNRFCKKTGGGQGTVSDTNLDDLEVWDNDVWPNDQYSQYVARFTGTGTGAGYLYLLARSANGDQSTTTTYQFWSDGGSDTLLIKILAGSITTLSTANATTFTSGDIFRLTASGTAISVTQNGSTILSATDSAVTTGSAGMGGFGVSGTVLFDDWIGDNVAAATSIPPGLGPVIGMEQLFHLDASLMR